MTEVKPKPTTDIDWSAGGANLDPGAPKKNAGWLFEEKPPHQFENWMQREQGLWTYWLRDIAARVFNTLSDAIATLLPGDAFRLAPDNVEPMNTAPPSWAVSNQNSVICSDGFAFYVYDTTDLILYAHRVDNGVALWNTTLAPVTAPLKISTDGEVVAICFVTGAQDEVVILEASTGAILVTAPGFVSVDDIVCASSGTGAPSRAVYWVDGPDVWIWTPAGGALVIINQPGWYCKAITISDNYIHLAQGVTAGQEPLYLRAYLLKSPYALVSAWQIAGAVNRRYAAICTDGDYIYISSYDGVVIQYIEKHPLSTHVGLAAVWGGTFSGGGGWPTLRSIAVDDRYLYVMTPDDQWVAIEKVSGGVHYVDTFGLSSYLCTSGDNILTTRLASNLVYRGSIERGHSLWVVSPGVDNGINIAKGNTRRPFFKRAIPLK